MGENTGIAWTDHTWNPWQGCHKVSPACDNCYMYRDKKWHGQDPTIVVRSSKPTFNLPFKLQSGKVFVCSWSDFFIEEGDLWRDESWDIIRRTPHLTYQILTKRPENIKDRLPNDFRSMVDHVWIGFTAENQEMFDKRVAYIRQIKLLYPDLIIFCSMEPLLGPINAKNYLPVIVGHDRYHWNDGSLNQIIVGGESGPKARPMHPEWVRSILDQCQTADVPFFFKQWGEWAYNRQPNKNDLLDAQKELIVPFHGEVTTGLLKYGNDAVVMKRVGKKLAGDLLDGKQYHEFPEVPA